jgi:hypothetical protein
MRSPLGLPGWCLFLAIGAASGCSRSIIDPASPRTDASTCDFGPGALNDGAAAKVAVAAIVTPSHSIAGDYLLALGNGPINCEITMPPQTCLFGLTYEVELTLPAQDLSPGVYPLKNLPYPIYTDVGPMPLYGSCCWGGGGDFVDGSLDILSVSSAGLVFQLQETSTKEFDANGTTFTAQLCPGVPGAAAPVDSGSP